MIAATTWLGIELLRPGDVLWGVLAALALAVLGVLGLALRRSGLARLVDPRQFARFVPGFDPGRARWRVVCAVAAALALGLALTGPVRGYTLRDVERRGLDLVVAIDTSRSMLVQDLSPSRLERAKREVKGLLDRLSGDRVALLAFAGDVRDVAPLTHDRRTLAAFVEGLDTNENLVGGTDVGAAIDRALALFDGATGAHEAIVLLTDGEDLAGGATQAAERAKERGIRLYIVGMGSSEGGKIPDGQGGFVRDEEGKEVVSALEADSLERLSKITGGDFLTTARAALPLEELWEKRLTKMETRELWAGKERIPHDRYQWLVAVAALFMGVETAVGDRRRRSGGTF